MGCTIIDSSQHLRGRVANHGFKINKQGIRRLQRDIQRELNKQPLRVPVDAETRHSAPTVVNHYSAPVVTVNGDHAQVSWDGGTNIQSHDQSQRVAEGYEDVAKTLADLLGHLTDLGLSDEDAQDLREAGEQVLAEVTQDEPDRRKVRRGVQVLKGLLAPVATGVSQAVTSESAELAREGFEALSQLVV